MRKWHFLALSFPFVAAAPVRIFRWLRDSLGLIGAGGMGEICRAGDVTLKREGAIKVLASLAVHQFGTLNGAPCR